MSHQNCWVRTWFTKHDFFTLLVHKGDVNTSYISYFILPFKNLLSKFSVIILTASISFIHS